MAAAPRTAGRVSALAVTLAISAGCTPARGPFEVARTSDPVTVEGLLTVTDQKDGDSFVASDGVEYRVGMINTPERNECGGAEATRMTGQLLAGGFTVEVYAADTHGRSVARVITSDGDLGVLLARRGFADDRYLDGFRSENPAYAAELEAAFAEARASGAGLYERCWADAG